MHTERDIQKLPCFTDILEISVLEGGLTNENYKVSTSNGDFVVRFSEDDAVLGISRENELSCLKNVLKLGIVPELVYQERGVLVNAFIDGQTLTPELAADEDVLSAVVASFKKLHDPLFEVEGRLYFVGPYRSITAHFYAIEKYNIAFDRDLSELRKIVRSLYDSLPPFKPVLCHADLVGENIIYDGKKAWLIDWEYGGMGDPLFDLGWFAVASDLSDQSCEYMLKTYYGGLEPQTWKDFNNMRALCALRDGLWGVVQTHNSDMDCDYHGHAQKYLNKFDELYVAL